jgi:hypothetical protein
MSHGDPRSIPGAVVPVAYSVGRPCRDAPGMLRGDDGSGDGMEDHMLYEHLVQFRGSPETSPEPPCDNPISQARCDQSVDSFSGLSVFLFWCLPSVLAASAAGVCQACKDLETTRVSYYLHVRILDSKKKSPAPDSIHIHPTARVCSHLPSTAAWAPAATLHLACQVHVPHHPQWAAVTSCHQPHKASPGPHWAHK